MRLRSTLLAVALLALAPQAARAQDKDIVETAAAAGSFKTLTKLLTDAGLAETLRGPGPFTVFAPTDEAFAKLPASTMATLTRDKAALKDILRYHVVAGKVAAADVARLSGKGAKTMQGSEAKVSMMGEQVMINNAHLVRGDVAASNGVIHVIDAVILPPGR